MTKALWITLLLLVTHLSFAGETRPNILLIVADDLNYDSLGYAGGVAPDVTPNIDRLASESFSFERAFTAVSVCQPSRQAMLSGRWPHNYGSGGFFPMAEGIPTLVTWLAEAGYLTGNIHKLHHMLPKESFPWDYDNEKLGLQAPDGVVGRDPQAIARGFLKVLQHADKDRKPFFMVVNSADPHRPFHGDPVRGGDDFWGYEDEITLKDPSRIYHADEVVVPPTLPDLPGVRIDLAKYASSIRRLDDTVGACLRVLEEAGKADSTLVIFVSDNGMPLPFAKFDCYLGSNHSPLLMRWPQFIREPVVDDQHLVSLIDITPTILDLTGLPKPENLDGQSLVPFLKGETPPSWRDSIVFLRNSDIYYGDAIRRSLASRPDFKQELEARGWVERPDHKTADTFSREKEMRCYFDGRYGYIYNDWYDPDGLDVHELGAGVPYPDAAFNAMKAAAAKDPAAAARVRDYLLREREQLFDWQSDPGSSRNLAADPDYAPILQAARIGLIQWMLDTGDPLLHDYRNSLD